MTDAPPAAAAACPLSVSLQSAHRCQLQASKPDQQCWCEGLNTATLLAPTACRQLQALLHEVRGLLQGTTGCHGRYSFSTFSAYCSDRYGAYASWSVRIMLLVRNSIMRWLCCQQQDCLCSKQFSQLRLSVLCVVRR